MRHTSLLFGLVLLSGCSLVLDVEDLAPSHRSDGGPDVGPNGRCERGDICDVARNQSAPTEAAIAGRRPFWIADGMVWTVMTTGLPMTTGIPADRLHASGAYLYALDTLHQSVSRVEASTLQVIASNTIDVLPGAASAVGPYGFYWQVPGGVIKALTPDLQSSTFGVSDAGDVVRMAAGGSFLVWATPTGRPLSIYRAAVNQGGIQTRETWQQNVEKVDSLASDPEYVAWVGVAGALRVERHDGTGGRTFADAAATRVAIGQFSGVTRIVFINQEGDIRSFLPDGTDEKLHAIEQAPESSLAVYDGMILWASSVDGYVRKAEP